MRLSQLLWQKDASNSTGAAKSTVNKMNSQMGSKTGGMSPMVMALGAAALAGGLYYYFWYIPSGQKAMVAIKDEADKLMHPERVERENREHARDAAAGRR